MTAALPQVAAIGAGRMGRGIAHVFAYAGFPVALVDLKPRPAAEAERLAAAALAEIRANLGTMAAAGLMAATEVETVLGRIRWAGRDQAAAALTAAGIVFEGVPERLEAKEEALRLVTALAPPETIIASTTSTIMVDQLASFVARPERFLNAHWLNPAYIIPLVEISPGAATAPGVVERMRRLLEQVGKVPVVCGAAPGFIVPRIQAIAMNEAARIVEAGLATAEDVDRATRYGLGFRFAILGMLEFIDWGGGDILYYASRYLTQALGSERYAAPDIIDRNMREGRLGLRSGEGFYDFRAIDADAYQRETLTKLLDLLRHLGLTRPPGTALAPKEGA